MGQPSQKTPAGYWLVISIAIVFLILLILFFSTGLMPFSLFCGLTILGLGITTAGFFLLRLMLKNSSMPQGWAHPLLDAKKARKELGLPDKNLQVKGQDVRNSVGSQEDDQYISDTDTLNVDELANEFIQMGRLLLKSGRYSEAKNSFLKATEQDPGNSKVYNYLGIACGRLNEHAQAVDAYNKAIALDYDYASAHFNLASVYDQLGDDENAITQWKRYLDVGKVVGERADMLERAKGRLQALKNGTDRVKKTKFQSSDDDLGSTQ